MDYETLQRPELAGWEQGTLEPQGSVMNDWAGRGSPVVVQGQEEVGRQNAGFLTGSPGWSCLREVPAEYSSSWQW